MSKKVKQSKVKKMSRRKKIIITIIILLVLIVITFSGFYVFSGYSKNSTTNKSNGITATKKTSVDTTTLSTEAASVVAKSGYAAGQEYLDKALESTSASNDKATIYLHKASLASSNSTVGVVISSEDETFNNKEALKYAYAAESISPSDSTAMTIAFYEDKLGNIANAINYYKIYINRVSKDDESYKYYENYVQYLESKK